MSKGLEAWFLVKKYFEYYHHKIVREDVPLETIEGMPLDIIEKELKALEIIKEKLVNLFLVNHTDSKEAYNDLVSEHCRELTQEEYNLLKEVCYDNK